MTPMQILRVLSARRWTIALGLAVGIVVAVALVVLTPKRYVATASIVVNGRADDPVRLVVGGGSGGPTVATQVDIIRRTRVAQRVVADLKLAADAGWRRAWEAQDGEKTALDAWIAAAVAGGLTVVSSPDSNVVDLQYKSEDRNYAARMANAFADAYLATILELRTQPAGLYVGFFDERLRDLRERLGTAQRRLADFERQNDIVGSAAGKADVETARFAELSSQLAVAQAQAADSASRVRGAARGDGTSPDVLSSPVVQELRSRVAAQDVKVQELASRYKPDYPGYKSAEIELSELRAKLAAEMKLISGSLGTAERVGTARVAEIRSALDAQRQRVLALQALRDQDEALRKEVESAQRTVDVLVQQQSQSTLESQVRQSDASLLGYAAVPFSPISPRVSLMVLLCSLAGLFGGLLVVFAQEIFRPVVRSADDVEAQTGVPVLSYVPNARSRRRLIGRSVDGSLLLN